MSEKKKKKKKESKQIKIGEIKNQKMQLSFVSRNKRT